MTIHAAALRTTLLLAAALVPAAAAQDYRAFWADAFSVGFRTSAEVTSMVNRAVSGRYNVIIVEVLAYHDRGAGGHGAYWNSAILPKAADISPGSFDPLADVVTKAHAQGIDVWAWIVPYRVSTVWPPPNNAYLAARPQWLMVPQGAAGGGPALIAGKYVLDPGSPEVQEYLVSIVRELATNYAIDGINLDYIRYETTDAGYPADAGYAQSTLARFQQYTGFVGTPPPTGNTGWNDFRRRTIDEFVRRLRAEVPAIVSNPRQPLACTADLIAFGNSPSGGNFNNADAYNLHQNWRMWMEAGWLDVGIPMNYKRDHNASQATWYRNWCNASAGWRYGRHMMAGQGNYLNTKANSVAQLSYALNTANLDGVCNFSYDATADENTNDVPETDWTWYTYVSANLFTAPATIPAMPWRDNATATDGTLWGRAADPDTGTPIIYATVQVGALAPVETDGNGYYVVTRIPAAGPVATNYTVTAIKSGCSNVVLNNVPILAGGLTRRDIDLCPSGPVGPLFGDMNNDLAVNAADFTLYSFCLRGPGFLYAMGNLCLKGDDDADTDVDMRDFQRFQQVFGQ